MEKQIKLIIWKKQPDFKGKAMQRNGKLQRYACNFLLKDEELLANHVGKNSRFIVLMDSL